MEQKHFDSIQGWFETLNQKVGRVEDNMATRQQLAEVDQKLDGVEKRLDLKIENRFQMLFTSMTNLSKKIESYHDQQNEEITVLRLALNDLQRQVKDLHQRFHS